MSMINPDNILEQPFSSVKSSIDTQLPLFPDSVIHHNGSLYRNKREILYRRGPLDNGYGVSRAYRILSPQLFLKKFDLSRDFLQYTLGLSVAQREVVLRLLKYWSYYGKVYPKEASITLEPGCSKATFWRTVSMLKKGNFITVVNRYVIRPHAQISNIYKFDKLLIMLARYLAEHGVAFREKWLTPILTMPGQLFWPQITQSPGARVGPLISAVEDLLSSRAPAS